MPEIRSTAPPALTPEQIFMLSPSVRYVATYRDGEVTMRQRVGLQNVSASESDRYEELFVNPALLTLAGQRGELDCGGLNYLVIRYGNFYQVVLRQPGGHLSVCVESTADVIAIAAQIRTAHDKA